MFVDANEVEAGSVLESDVCVVGAGAAGITLATAVAKLGLSVSLVESGGLEPDPATQRLYNGVTVGIPYPLTGSRVRYFGGSTNAWGGLCSPLDEVDFLPRPWVDHSGWPIRKSELTSYYERALAVLDLPALYRFDELERDIESYPRLLPRRTSVYESLAWLRSPPTRMGTKFRDEIARSSRIRCVLHANAVELVPSPTGSTIVTLRARTLKGKSLSFSSRQYVLATGGIENARLLLLSDSVIPRGIGNRYDLVGRFFSEHLNHTVGRMIVASPAGTRVFQEEELLRRSRTDLPGVWNLFFGFATTPSIREAHRLLACSINAVPMGRQEADATADAVGSLVGGPTANVDREGPRTREYGLAAIAEQSPNPNSRVYLASERDPLGQRRVEVDLQLRPLDLRSTSKSARLFGLELGRSGHGRVQLRAVGRPFAMAGHPMGTTRMADDPKQGVTDRNGKVHGIANLYVAGSSVFPNGGYANPTFTIVALALRLADRLKVVSETRAPEVRGNG